MKSVVLVGTNYENNLFIAKKISKLLNVKIIDLDNLIKEKLLTIYDFPLQLADKYMQKKESEIIKQIVSESDVIITIKDDEFLANDNYKYFENLLTVLIEYPQKNKICENIQKILKKHCKISLNYENLKLKDLVTLIRG